MPPPEQEPWPAEPDQSGAPTGVAGPDDSTAEQPAIADMDEPTAAPGQAADKRKRSRRSFLREVPLLVVIALIIAMVIKTFVVQAFVIPTGSMQNTLAINDKILVNKLVYHFRSIEPGDIVVFNGADSWDPPVYGATTTTNPVGRLYDDTVRKLFDSIGGLFGTPVGQTDYVKRVIGVPGDHVRCCNAQGLITVNGVALHEQSYLYPGNQPSSSPPGIPGRFSVTVPPGYLWVLGDHRAISDDSRGHEADPGGGMIPESQVIGRVFMIVWPPSQWRVLPIPATFQQPGVDHPAGSAAQQRATTAAATADVLTAKSYPSESYLPLAAGFALAVPLTWLQRSTRRRLRARLRRRRSAR